MALSLALALARARALPLVLVLVLPLPLMLPRARAQLAVLCALRSIRCKAGEAGLEVEEPVDAGQQCRYDPRLAEGPGQRLRLQSG